MSIITTSTPPILTLEQKQRKAKNKINAAINAIFAQMRNVFTSNMEIAWDNEDDLTAQQVFDAFGTDAGEVARLAELLKATINSAKADTIMGATPATLTTNPDGTVTVSA